MKVNNNFKIEAFLEENYKLITIMGIFGAISIYLNSLNQNNDRPEFTLQIGIVSSLLLLSLISIIIFLRAFEKQDNNSLIISFLSLDKGNLMRILFIIPFSLLIFSIIFYIFTTFPIPSDFIIGFILYVVGMMFIFGTVSFIFKSSRIKNKSLGSFIVGILLLLISSIGYWFLESLNILSFLLFFNSLATGSLILIVIIVGDFIYGSIKLQFQKLGK